MDANFPRMWADRLLVPARPVGTGDRQPARRGLGGLHGQRPAAGTATTTASTLLPATRRSPGPQPRRRQQAKGGSENKSALSRLGSDWSGESADDRRGFELSPIM